MARQTKINPQQQPERYSYGSNQKSTKRVFNERLKYDNYVFPDFLADNYVKTWTEDRFYGIVNHRGNAVTTDVRRLKTLQFGKEDTESYYALDFVADAWFDFATQLRKLADENVIFRDSPWARPTVAKAWASISPTYDSYIRESIYPTFAYDFMKFGNNNRTTKNVSDFLDRMDDFLQNILLKYGPITLSGLVEANQTPIYSSGLIIEISSDAYDDDFNKAYKFGDRNYSLVTKLASQYGFAVDKNIPWRLVADLRNPVMLEYMLGVPIVEVPVGEDIQYDCEPLIGDVELPPRAYGYSQIEGLENVIRHISFFEYRDESYQLRREPGYRRFKTYTGSKWKPSFATFYQQEVFKAFFEQDTTETWSSDITIFEDYLVDFYNFYVSENFQVTTQRMVPTDSICGPRTESFFRLEIDEEEFSDVYADKWRLKTFYVLRSKERGYKINSHRQRQEIQQMMNKYNLLRRVNPEGAYIETLRSVQNDFIGPVASDPLTLNTVGDIINSKRG